MAEKNGAEYDKKSADAKDDSNSEIETESKHDLGCSSPTINEAKNVQNLDIKNCNVKELHIKFGESIAEQDKEFHSAKMEELQKSVKSKRQEYIEICENLALKKL